MSFAPQHPDAPNIFPYLVYRNSPAALKFLKDAFAFEEVAVMADEDGRVAHAELKLGPGIIMMGGAKDGQTVTQAHVFVSIGNVDEHFARAKAAGAEIDREPYDTDYGSHEYAAKDPEGNFWYFGTYQPA